MSSVNWVVRRARLAAFNSGREHGKLAMERKVPEKHRQYAQAWLDGYNKEK